MSQAVKTEAHGADRILAAAQRLFAQKGFDATSMQEIAEAAGVSKSNVFHHFKSKEDLYVAVIGCACDEVGCRVFPLLGGSEPFADRLQRMMTADIEFLLEDPQRTQLVLREIMNTDHDDPTQPAPTVLRANADVLMDAIRAAQKAGEIRPEVDPAAVAFMFIASNRFYFQTRGMMRHFDVVDFADDHRRFVSKIADLLLNGVNPR